MPAFCAIYVPGAHEIFASTARSLFSKDPESRRIRCFLRKAFKESRRLYKTFLSSFKELADVDITKEPMEVGPTSHYSMGGVRVDADSTATTVPGLFAAGEVAAGLHGANRLGGNSLSAMQIIAKVTNTFEVDLPLFTLFDTPTIAALSEQMEFAGHTDQDLQEKK